MSDQVLHLVVPGLLGPMSRLDDVAAGRRFPVIERWLARADRCPAPVDIERLLFKLFDVPVPDSADLPTAAVCYLADTGAAPASVVYHATPVHLLPDQDRLLLFDSPASDLTAAEAAAFVEAFNAHFAEDGWRLEAPVPDRWYLHVDGQARLRTHPLGEVIGRNLDLFQPEGEDAATWQQRHNELQMLFHGLPVNQQREFSGRPAVNSLWLHGGGSLPEAAGCALVVEQGDTPLLQGLATLSQGSSSARLHWIDDARRVVWDAQPGPWLAALERIEATLSSVPQPAVLYPGDGNAYHLQTSGRWRLWRRPRPLLNQLLPECLD